MKKRIIIPAVLLVLVAGGYAFYFFHRPRPGVDELEAHFEISAEALADEFFSNEKAAGRKYVGKVLRVEGAVSEVQGDEQGWLIFLAGKDVGGGVSCAMRNGRDVPPRVGKRVSVKGLCAGYLMEVQLTDAVLIRQEGLSNIPR